MDGLTGHNTAKGLRLLEMLKSKVRSFWGRRFPRGEEGADENDEALGKSVHFNTF